MNNSSRHTEGFTLVELLVTLSLLSVMAIYAFNAFSLTGKMKTIAINVEKETEVQSVLRHFHEEVSALTPVYGQDTTGAAKLIFEGRQATLSYASLANGTREVGGLYQVTWQLNEKRQLTMKRHLLRTSGVGNVDIVVLDDVENVAFSYNGDQPVWLEQQTLPKVISLKLALVNRVSKAEVAASIVSGQ